MPTTQHYHISGKGGRKRDEEHSMKKMTRADGTSIQTQFVSYVSCVGAVNKRADSGMEKPSKGRGMPSDVKSHKRALSWSGTATGTGIGPQSSESKTKSQAVSNDAEDGGRCSKEQHSHANVPDVTGVTTSATQTTADDEDCDAMVPMVCVRLVTSLQVRPHQSVLAQVRTDTDHLNSDPLLLQYQNEVDESLGVCVGDSLICPGPDSASHVLLINTSRFTRHLQAGGSLEKLSRRQL